MNADMEAGLEQSSSDQRLDLGSQLEVNSQRLDFESGLDLDSQQSLNIVISNKPLNLQALIAAAHANQGESGAVVTFTGAVRVSSEEAGLTGMSLEHYPGMTEAQLKKILEEANQRWRLNKATVVHRVGYLEPGEPIVFVATSGLHRKESFAAAEFIMDYLKTRATFWKKEHYGDQVHWVEAKQSDVAASKRWE